MTATKNTVLRRLAERLTARLVQIADDLRRREDVHVAGPDVSVAGWVSRVEFVRGGSRVTLTVETKPVE